MGPDPLQEGALRLLQDAVDRRLPPLQPLQHRPLKAEGQRLGGAQLVHLQDAAAPGRLQQGAAHGVKPAAAALSLSRPFTSSRFSAVQGASPAAGSMWMAPPWGVTIRRVRKPPTLPSPAGQQLSQDRALSDVLFPRSKKDGGEKARQTP